MFDDSGCPPEADLCEELGVSCGSLCEAVRKLAALGVVEPRHGSGTYVSPPIPEDLIGSLSLNPSTPSAAGPAGALRDPARAGGARRRAGRRPRRCSQI